jgi:hypothetical protein
MLPSSARWGSQPPPAPATTDSPASTDEISSHIAADEGKKGLRKVVLDSGAIIKGRRLEALGDTFWTVCARIFAFLILFSEFHTLSGKRFS